MDVMIHPSLLRGAASRPGVALLLFLLLSTQGATEVLLPSLFQPQPSVLSGQGNPQIWCVVRGSPIRAHVLSWYQKLQGRSPTFLLSQRHGAPPTYGLGVNSRFLAEMDLAQNAARLTVGNASPADEGIYYCAMWFSGLYIFGEGTHLFYQAEVQAPALPPPALTLFVPASGTPSLALCVALGQHPAPLRISWVLRGQHQEEDEFTGRPGGPLVSWLQLPREAAGTTVSCQGLHQSGAAEAALHLPRNPGCRGLGLNWNETQESGGDIPLELEHTLAAITYCYLGLLGATPLYGLILVTVWRNRFRLAHPRVPPTQEAQGAAPDSRTQAGRGHSPARTLEDDAPCASNPQDLASAACAPASTDIQPASS
ncbi:immunoglobulin alpha-2 heavy chain-like isoform X2 [Sciurus carolinensis]|uniref:immunoglobulin alpha-2 heavy chain-like isoform X2 n=1 Tax=Sciurus carolinensis TaxID=30640 RepID=UPI001FB3658D|nr:immunoglobulin alpha-2 heavy chain-like isoform X2 [Sciurus carolinensis]